MVLEIVVEVTEVVVVEEATEGVTVATCLTVIHLVADEVVVVVAAAARVRVRVKASTMADENTTTGLMVAAVVDQV